MFRRGISIVEIIVGSLMIGALVYCFFTSRKEIQERNKRDMIFVASSQPAETTELGWKKLCPGSRPIFNPQTNLFEIYFELVAGKEDWHKAVFSPISAASLSDGEAEIIRVAGPPEFYVVKAVAELKQPATTTSETD